MTVVVLKPRSVIFDTSLQALLTAYFLQLVEYLCLLIQYKMKQKTKFL